MSTFCSALAYATELSDRTLAATAALIGAARLALIRDMASRSGSSSTDSASISSGVSSLCFSVMELLLGGSDALGDGSGLGGVRPRGGVVGEDVGRYGSVDGYGDV